MNTYKSQRSKTFNERERERERKTKKDRDENTVKQTNKRKTTELNVFTCQEHTRQDID